MSLPAVTPAPSSTFRSKAVETKIFINRDVSEYSLLSSCAQIRVSTIVRDMQDGCGDDKQTTSYLCFCQTSSSYFDSLISARIATTCSDQPQASLGRDVFNKYCQVGSTSGRIPASASAISTASPSVSTTSSALSSSILATISSPATVQTLSASSSTPSSTTSPSKSNGHTKTIALVVSIPIAVIALLAAGFLLYRYRKGRRGRVPEKAEFLELPSEKREQTVTSELAAEQKYRHDPAELPANKKRASAVELPGHEVGKGD